MKRFFAGAMRSFYARVVVVVLIAAAVGALFAVVPDAPSSDKSYEVTDADVAVVLQRDGSLLVHEALDFDFTGSFTGAYRDIRLNGDARITNVRVSESGRRYEPGGNTELGSFDFPGTFGTQDFQGTSDLQGAADAASSDRFKRVVWHYEASDETRTFDLGYRVVGATNIRDDVVDVTWTVWGDQWDFWLNHLDAEISSAAGLAPVATWLRPRSLGADPSLGDNATTSVDRLPEGENVGMRAVFPRDAVRFTGGGEVERGDGLAEIEQEESRLDDGYSLFAKLRNGVSDNVLTVTIVLALLGLAGISVIVILARERPTGVPKYLPEPPENFPPAVGYALAHEGGYDQRIVLATLMDLVDRGFYDARAAPGTELDLEIRVAQDRPPDQGKGGLETYEVATLDFFDRIVAHKWVAIGKMKDKVPEHSTAWHSRWNSLNEQLDEAEKDYVIWDRNLSSWRTALVVAFLLLFAAVIALQFTRTQRVPIPITGMIATIGIMIAVPGSWVKRLAAEPRLRNAQWQAFERWTRDFPRLDDDPPATLKLWRRILVYAVAFGTAERVASSGRIPAPVADEAERTGIWAGYAFYPHSFGSFDSFGSGFSSQVAPQSSGGGGGFSGGGGGGFSGGGGGGAW